MNAEPRMIQASDIQFLDKEKTRAVCLSMSDSTLVYHIDLTERTCECNSFHYSKKIPPTCKHLESASRLKSMQK